MAQAAVNLKKLLSKKSVSTQTGETVDFFINLSSSKRARLYYSEAYQDVVLSFNINSSKSFIITKSMWKKLRPFINKIDNVLN